MPTYSEQLQRIVSEYQSAGQPWPTTTRGIAAWAIHTKRWFPQPSALIQRCAEELGEAMREEYIVDFQGRRVRAKHAARFGSGSSQTTLWADIRTASPGHMRVAFQQRRRQILADCRQLKNDVDSYNENSTPSVPIQVVLDFSLDLAEEAALTAAS